MIFCKKKTHKKQAESWRFVIQVFTFGTTCTKVREEEWLCVFRESRVCLAWRGFSFGLLCFLPELLRRRVSGRCVSFYDILRQNGERPRSQTKRTTVALRCVRAGMFPVPSKYTVKSKAAVTLHLRQEGHRMASFLPLLNDGELFSDYTS